MPRYPTLTACFALGLSLAGPGHGADCLPALSQHRIQVWDAQNGLPLDSVLALARGSNGLLWVGTEEGLSRFDGTAFEPVDLTAPLRGDPPYIEHLAVAPDDSVLVATSEAGLLVVDRGRAAEARNTPLEDAWVQSVLVDPEGTVWAAGREAGLMRLKDGAVTRWEPADGLAGPNVTALARRAAGGVWLGYAGGGVQWFDDGEFGSLEAGGALADVWVEGVHEARDGTLWIATRDGLYRHGARGLRRFGLGAGLRDVFVEAVTEDAAGRIWAATATGGVARLCQGRFETLGHQEGLPSNRIEQVLADGRGGMWLATGGGGIVRLSVGAAVPITPRQGLPERPILPVLRLDRGVTWAGTYGAGLVRIDGLDFQTVDVGDDQASQSVFALAEDGAGGLWAGTRGGLYRVADGRVAEHLTTADGLPHDTVASLLRDGPRLWIGVVGGVAALEAGQISTYRTTGAAIRSNVTGLLRDHRQTLWVATHGDGLYRLWDGVLEPAPFQAQMPTDTVLSLFEDRTGVLWVGTSNGLLRWDGETARRVGREQGLPEHNVYSIREDGVGDLWISGNLGVYRLEGERLAQVLAGGAAALRVRRFDRTDGMPSSETNGGFQPAVSEGPDGRLWYPTLSGIAVFDPGKIRSAAAPPLPLIKALTFPGRREAGAGEVTVPPSPSSLEFQFSAVEFSQPEDLQFQYRVRDLDDAWFDTTEHQVTYRQMPPGSFTFDLRARVAGEAWSQPVSQRFVVERHVLQYRWVWVAGALAAVAALAGGFRLWRRRLALRQQQARDAQKLESLGQLAGGIAHDFNNILAGIIAVADSVAERLQPGTPLRRDADLILKAGERGAALTRQLMTFARRGGGDVGWVDLAEEVSGMEIFLRRVLPGNIELPTRIEPAGRCYTHAAKVQQVVLNLALNARDAMAGGGTLGIELCRAGDGEALRRARLDSRRTYARLVVWDTGTGMDRATRKRLFEPFFSTKGEGTGLGLAVTHNIVHELDGAIEVETAPGRGTRFSVYLPVRDAEGGDPGEAAGLRDSERSIS